MSWHLGKYGLGVLFIVLCAIIWAGASVLIQFIYEDLDFQSPFFVTYIATSLLSLHIPAWYVTRYVKNYLYPNTNQQMPEDLRALMSTTSSFQNLIPMSMGESNIPDYVSPQHWEMIKIAMVISPLWFGANCFYNYSLLMTTVSSSTIISNLSASFTLAFSWFMGIEEVTMLKTLGILVCFAGAVGVGLQDEESNDDGTRQTVGGDAVALLGAAGYGLYTTAIRYKVPDEDAISMQLLLGYIGLINAIVLLPALLILFFLRMANVQAITGEVVGFVALNGFCDTVIADYFWARAVILTSPTVATIGMSITIPFAVVTDYCINGIEVTWISILGAFLVLVGFVLVSLTKENVQQIKDVFCVDRGEAVDEDDEPKRFSEFMK